MLKVLVVDDEILVRNGIVMETDWNALGCMVVAEGANGLEGLEAARKYEPDIIVCDIRMPKMDGLEMIGRLREEGNKAYVIFLTAYSDFSYAQKAIKLSAADYLLKPFEDGELEKTIMNIRGKIMERQQKEKEDSEREILSHIQLRRSDKSKYVMEALSYIGEHYHDPELGIREIAEVLGLSESRLSHVFKKETDYTVNAYITRYRISSAMKLLTDCRYKVYEVAEKVGYKDTTYFSAIFKKITGLNPSEYQNRIRNKH